MRYSQRYDERSLVVAGAGGHAKSVIEVLLECEDFDVVGCTSADGCGVAVLGVPVIGTDEDLTELFANGVTLAFAGIGDNPRRRAVTESLQRIGFGAPSLVSPGARLARDVEIGAGSVAMPGAIVRTGARIARGVILNTGASVDHDCTVEEFAHLAPGVRLAGSVHVGRNAFVGIGSVVTPGVRIGEDALIGAGSLVLRDVPAGRVVFGSPARIVRNRLGGSDV